MPAPSEAAAALRAFVGSGLASIAQADEWQAAPRSSARLEEAQQFMTQYPSSPYTHDLKCGIRNVLQSLASSSRALTFCGLLRTLSSANRKGSANTRLRRAAASASSSSLSTSARRAWLGELNRELSNDAIGSGSCYE